MSGSDVLETLENLLALAGSANENEARNAAVQAVKLIRRHRLVVTLPARADHVFRGRARSEPAVEVPRRPTPSAARKPSPVRGVTRTRSSKKTKQAADPPEKIVAPLGGECIHCKTRYPREAAIYWFPAGGGMHARCFELWSRGAPPRK
jgi:hypothetical protein